MVKYPLKRLFFGRYLLFLTRARVRKTGEQGNSLYGKIAVFRRLVRFLNVYFQKLLNCLQMLVEQFGTRRITEYFTGICVYPIFNGLYALVAYRG